MVGQGYVDNQISKGQMEVEIETVAGTEVRRSGNVQQHRNQL